MAILDEHNRSDIYDPASRRVAITVGLLFLAATLTFMIGDSLIGDFFSAPAGTADTGTLAVGVVLQALCGLAVAGIGLALLKLLGRYSTRLANGYLAFRCLECAVIIAFGAYMFGTRNFVQNYELLIYTFTGLGGLMLAYLLYKSELVPEWLAWLGMVGYVVILLAIPSDLLNVATLDSGLGMLFYVPGGMFELLLPILLIARGFRRTETEVATSVAEGRLSAAVST